MVINKAAMALYDHSPGDLVYNPSWPIFGKSQEMSKGTLSLTFKMPGVKYSLDLFSIWPSDLLFDNHRQNKHSDKV